MDDNLGYVFAAFAITWLAISGYMIYVGQQVRELRDEVRSLDEQDDSTSV